MKPLFRSACLFLTFLASMARADVTLDLGTAKLSLDDTGVALGLVFADGTHWPGSGQPVFVLEGGGASHPAHAVARSGDALRVAFDDGSTALFRLTERPGMVLLRLESLAALGPVERFRLFRLDVPAGAKVGGTLNAAFADGRVAAVMAAEPNVEARTGGAGASRADRPGCAHQIQRSDQARVGRSSAEFRATADANPGGWSYQGRSLERPLDLTGCKAIRAWVHGDGQGEQLKIQLFDGTGGYRDDYVIVDFVGWKRVTLATPALNSLKYDHVAALNLYYNSLPPGRTVSCRVDQIEAVIAREGRQDAVLLEDFESPGCAFFAGPGETLEVSTHKRHGLQPAAFGVLAAPRGDFWTTVERFESVAGIPSPRLGGQWNKTSSAIKRSYFFLTDFRETQFDQALAIARRGGFSTILLGQESWSEGTGHYAINRERFPDGLRGLSRTLARFRDQGFKVGLHFLAASIYPPDPYITPVPDRRLVLGAVATLAAGVDEKADVLPTVAAPAGFPAEDGGYEGDGPVLRIGDELISYGVRSMSAALRFHPVSPGIPGHQGGGPPQGRAGRPPRPVLRLSYVRHGHDPAR